MDGCAIVLHRSVMNIHFEKSYTFKNITTSERGVSDHHTDRNGQWTISLHYNKDCIQTLTCHLSQRNK